MNTVRNVNMNTLQSLVLPNLDVQAPEDLYVRLNAQAWCQLDQPAVHFEAGGVAFTDTYYGALSLTTWRRHCTLKEVLLQLEGEGRFVVSLGVHRHHQATVWVGESTQTLQRGEPVEMALPNWSGLPDGLLFFRLRALTPGRLDAARYVTPQPVANAVRMGLVITHFNRIQQVLPAVERIRRSVLSRPDLRERLSLTVVDNSRNLPLKSDALVTVISNRNLGGSGGFARGLLSLVDSGTHTHALLMDDDASCEPESIARTLALLSHAHTPRLAVVGALISELHPWHLLENGAGFDGFCKPLGIGRDLRQMHNLMQCDRGDSRPDFGGWWFFAFKLAEVRRWPFPFFVRGDDVFFGLGNQFEITTLSGVACFGEDFHLKHGPMTAYLDARYHLLHAILRERGALKAVMRVLKLRFVKPLEGYHYSSARALTLALQHLRRGPQFFRDNMDLSQVRPMIAALQPDEKLGPIDRKELNLRMPRRTDRESMPRRVLRVLTLGGFLLPNALIRDRVLLHEKDFFGRAYTVWRYRRVLYRHGPTDTGYIVEMDRARFFAEVRDLLHELRLLIKQMPDLRRAYAEAMEQMGSLDFWREVYGMPARTTLTASAAAVPGIEVRSADAVTAQPEAASVSPSA
jgi:hypothetical protein